MQGLRTSALAHICDEDSDHLGQLVVGMAGLADVDRASAGEREAGSDDQAGSFAGRTFRCLSEWAFGLVVPLHLSLRNPRHPHHRLPPERRRYRL